MNVPTCPALFRFYRSSTVRPPSLKAADFQRALGSRPVARSAHFVLHVLRREAAALAPSAALLPELSTGEVTEADALVDDFVAHPTVDPQSGPAQGWRLGLVLPKKQARRSVTRSLIRHQAREALRRHVPALLAKGQVGQDVDGWVLRLRAPFDKQLFPSAASDALKVVVRQELDELWLRLAASPASEGGRSRKESAGKPLSAARGAA